MPSADFKIDSPEFQAKLQSPEFCDKFKLPSGGVGLHMESPEIKAMLKNPDFHVEMGWPAANLPAPSAPSGSWFGKWSLFGSPSVEVSPPSVDVDAPNLDLSAGGGVKLPSGGNLFCYDVFL